MTAAETTEWEMIEATRRTLNLLTGRWTIDILYLLAAGRRRYNRVYYEVGEISKKALTATLRRLERDGLVARHVVPGPPLSVEYSLTPLGWSLTEPMVALYEWAAGNAGAPGAARAEPVHPRPSAGGR